MLETPIGKGPLDEIFQLAHSYCTNQSGLMLQRLQLAVRQTIADNGALLPEEKLERLDSLKKLLMAKYQRSRPAKILCCRSKLRRNRCSSPTQYRSYKSLQTGCGKESL